MHDSIDKIITTYFACVASKPFTYKKKTYLPKRLAVGQTLLRDYSCLPNCGACCLNYTLDYLPCDAPDTLLDKLELREIFVNDTSYFVYSDLNEFGGDGRHCRNLDLSNGRCGIHPDRAFSCKFELTRFLKFKGPQNRLITKLYGRGWNMERIDGTRGALCEMKDANENSVVEVLSNLRKLDEWATHFGLTTCIRDIIVWIESGDWMARDLLVNSQSTIDLVPMLNLTQIDP